MKISKKVREEAALFCAAFASTNSARWTNSEARECLGVSYGAQILADRACVECGWLDANGAESDQVAHAEAEALLRDGWSP